MVVDLKENHSARPVRASFYRTIIAILFIAVACGTEPRVAAPPGQNPIHRPSFELVVIGDFGTGNEEEMAIARDIRIWVRRHRAAALVTTGDNVYPDGEPRYFNEAWHRPYGWVDDAGLEVVASLGNHDVEDDGGVAVMRLMNMPARWYRRRIGAAEMFVLDANRPQDRRQLAWLDEALASSGAVWRIAVFHQPAFSCGRHKSTPEVIDNFVPLLKRHHVDLVLNGHDHNYQRFPPLHRTTYVVTGGGGDTLYELGDCPQGTPKPAVSNDEAFHFVYVEGSRARLRVRAITEAGATIDDFSIKAGE